MKKSVFILLAFFFLWSCNKDNNILIGTSWVSTYSEKCAWENEHLDGDYSEVLTFDEKAVQSRTLKNGYVYRNNYSCDYAIDNKIVTVFRYIDTIQFRVNGNIMTQLNTGWLTSYTFYKQ